MLDKRKKKELASAYAQFFRPMGVYQIRNLDNDKIYVDASMDLDGSKNRLAFMSLTDRSPISELQADWKTYGGNRFVFELLDRLKPREEMLADRSELEKYSAELDTLLELWLEKLEPYGDKGYNRRKK